MATFLYRAITMVTAETTSPFTGTERGTSFAGTARSSSRTGALQEMCLSRRGTCRRIGYLLYRSGRHTASAFFLCDHYKAVRYSRYLHGARWISSTFASLIPSNSFQVPQLSMKYVFARPYVLKIAASAAISIIAVVGFSGYLDTGAKVAASASGPSPSHTNAPNEDNCTACHIDFPVNSGGGELKVTGLPNNYLPNQQIPMTVTLKDDAVKYGFQITAIDSHGERIGSYTLSQ